MGGFSVLCLEPLQQLSGVLRQRALRRLREKLQQELSLLSQARGRPMTYDLEAV